MYRFIDNNKKFFMAIFMVVLMVAFLLPAGIQNMVGTNQITRATYGGGKKLTTVDYQRADQSWRLLQTAVVRPASFAQDIPLIMYLGGVSSFDILNAYQGRGGVLPFQIAGNSQTFLLLLKEAEDAGVVISDERLNEVMSTDVQLRSAVDAGTNRAIREAVRDFLKVQASYARVASLAKASEPMRERELAQRGVNVSAEIAVFDANPTAAVPTSQPSREQLVSFFDKYKAVAPGSATADELGFGYRLPDAVKVQTLTIPAASIKAIVEKSKTPRQWDVETRTYVYKNISEFPATQPASTQAAALPGTPGYDMTAAPASTQQVERTYDDLTAEQKTQARQRIMQPAIDALSNRVVAYLNDRLSKDYTAATPATQPTTQPTTSAATGYLSYAYLEEVAQDVQKQFGVLPTVANHADWLDRAAAGTLPGVGTASTQGDVQNMQSFGAMALGVGAISGRPSPAALRLNEFSQPLADSEGNLYLFRATDARPSRPADSLDDVLAQVTVDYARQTALDGAVSGAKALVESAKSTPFAQAASSAGKSVVNVGPIDLQNTFGEIEGLDIPASDRMTFLRGVANLLTSESRNTQGHPLGTITLASAGKVLAVHLTTATVTPSTENAFLENLGAGLFEQRAMSDFITLDWFSFDGVSKRMGFEGDRPAEDGIVQ